MQDDVLTRWRSFVQKLTERYQQILTESDAGFQGLLQDPNLDPITFGNAMSAIEIRVKELRTKLGDTYTQNVVGHLSAMKPAEQLMRQTEDWLEEHFEHWRVGWNGRLVRSIWTRAQALMHRKVGCSKCGAELKGRTVFHQAESVGCTHCGAVNSVTPDTLVYTYFAMAPDMIADEQTVKSKLGLDRARRAGASRGQMIELSRQHWRAFVAARAQIAPMSAEEQERFVASRVRFEEQWG
jgi:hypothetical protein